jgi:FliI/YscN family ATPase
MGMISRGSNADINIICLVGERGREVQEFITDHLGPEGLERSVVVAATSDRPALERLKALAVATTIAEHFRDQGQDVLLMCDSLTRLAMAQREIGLSIGEPPATRGYPPSVWAVLPQLLERAGRTQRGSITGLYTVLVEGDDMNEPIADAARAILDGHTVLSRDLAHRNHYPAVDVLESVSRLQSSLLSPEVLQAGGELRELLASYRSRQDMIALGAYQAGTEPNVDRAIELHQQTEDFLTQASNNLVASEQADSELLDLMLTQQNFQPQEEIGNSMPLMPTLAPNTI